MTQEAPLMPASEERILQERPERRAVRGASVDAVDAEASADARERQARHAAAVQAQLDRIRGRIDLRPCKRFNAQTAAKAIGYRRQGLSADRISRIRGMPTAATLEAWRHEVPAFDELWTRGYRSWLEGQIEDSIALGDATYDGTHELDPRRIVAVHNSVKHRQWLASKLLRSDYGEQQEATPETPVLVPAAIEVRTGSQGEAAEQQATQYAATQRQYPTRRKPETPAPPPGAEGKAKQARGRKGKAGAEAPPPKAKRRRQEQSRQAPPMGGFGTPALHGEHPTPGADPSGCGTQEVGENGEKENGSG